MSIIYAVSGIALNHIRDFNPNYHIERYNLTVPAPISGSEINKEWVENLLQELEVEESFKQSYFPEPGKVKIFLRNGNMEIDLESGKGLLETVRRRPILFQVNFLHYNPGKLWKWFSDIFCLAWITVSITGLFIIKSGKHSIKRRGAIWTIAGIIIPAILLLLYL